MSEHAARLAAADRRLAHVARHRDRLARRSRRLGNLRLLVFGITVAAVAVAIFTFGDAVAWTLAGLGFVVFQGLVLRHTRVEGARRRWQVWSAWQQKQRARLDLDWNALDRPHDDAIDAGHPFAHDLDLVGPRSLLHRIDTTVSTGGFARLKSWLLEPVPDPERIDERQRRVAALTGRRHFRDRLGVVTTEGLGARRTHWDTGTLAERVGREHDTRSLRWRTAVLSVLAIANVTLIAGAATDTIGPWWGLTVPAYFMVYVFSLRDLAPLFDESLRLQELLEPLRAVLGWMEDRAVPPAVEPVVAPLRRTSSHRPAAVLRKTNLVVWAAALRTNQLLWLIVNVAVPWDMIFALRLAGVRRELREHLPHWLDALHEIEALCALANLADLEPGHCFPAVTPEGPPLAARGLGHPLLHPEARVRNDFEVDALGRVFLLTGSNMSGKSTFLRTVGLNVVLANAGSVVLADAMRLRPLRPFTCIQVSDSVNDGISYFYAEVRRLAALLRSLEDGGPLPQISLIDEIYRGTNNRERWAGSRAFVEHLVGRAGVVLLSTHDLELAELERTHDAVRNLHFREEVKGRRMAFDFVLREGPCPTTNALELMRREGLPVPVDPEATDEPTG